MKIRKLQLVLLLLFDAAFKSVAASFPPQPQAIPPPVGAPLPIDSEIWILFASGIALGMYFFLKNPKSKANLYEKKAKIKIESQTINVLTK